jgi:DNA-damage-inducible protein D
MTGPIADVVQVELERMKRIAPNGEQFWMARDLQNVLGYVNWENFEKVIAKGIEACRGSEVNPQHHFLEARKMIEAGKGAKVERADWYLTRYACYLIAMNGESKKPEIAKAQSYFAVQTRLQELQVERDLDGERITLRERVRVNNKTLAGVAKDCGVERFGIFNDAGYRGLYGMSVKELKEARAIPPKESVLDYSGRAELAAHDFRITQTEQRLKSDRVRGESAATEAHRAVGAEVRAAMKRAGGTMPENLPKEPHIRTLISARKKNPLLKDGKSKPKDES